MPYFLLTRPENKCTIGPMKLRTFGEFVEEIKTRQGWDDVFPPEVDYKRSRHYAEGQGGYFPPGLASEGPFLWPGAKDVLNILEHRALSGPGLYAAVRAFRKDVQRIHEGLLRYGKYTKDDRITDRPQEDYVAAVRVFMRKISRADPLMKVEPFERSLLSVNGRGLQITNERHRELIDAFSKRFLAGLRAASREGRPVQPDNILIYHLVNNLTAWRRKRDGTAMKDKRGRFKLERRWDDVAHVLIWVHYKRMTIPWVSSFLQRYARSSIEPTLLRLKKVIQRKYAHLGPPADQGISAETAFHPLNIKVFTYVEDEEGKSGFKEFEL